jgi:hypothetical protein
MLAGCGGSQPPIDAPGAMPQTSAIATHAERGKSWILPEAKSEDLLYASSGRTIVSVFNYRTGKLVGTLSGFSGADGECVDKTGDVFITNTDESAVLEYSHGSTTPINTLSDPGYEPYGCSVDPTTGNLAVSNFDGGSVAVYSDAQGDPTVYSIPEVDVQFCGYDNSGNLFIDGLGHSFAFELFELPRGSGTVLNISLNQNPWPGPIEWDGKHLALGYGGSNSNDVVIYQLSVSGSTATVVGSTSVA